MIDFNKRLRNNERSRPKDPIEIYESLDRAADKGPLRPTQLAVLSSWHKERSEDENVIVKLHTGEGKTLIGLLMLQSSLNSSVGPCVYVCPNNYLVEQTCQQADQFGIDYVVVGEDRSLPEAFLDSKRLLIATVQKLFNGKSKFGLGHKSMTIGSIVLDDSHACIASIEDSARMTINKGGAAYTALLSMFEDYLKEQGLAMFKEIELGESWEILEVPYWAWQEKQEAIVEALLSNKHEIGIFEWELLKDIIGECRCIVSSNRIEIEPISFPLERYRFFTSAKRKIFMSATTNNDAAFVKSFKLSRETILHPLEDKYRKWSGEKMLLIPYYLDSDLGRSAIVNWLGKPDTQRAYGVIALTPSYDAAEFWESVGAIKAETTTIKSVVDGLKAGKYSKTVAFANRYDGIDLPDSNCRILILDEKPYAQSLADLHQEKIREASEIVSIKTAQKIEQGLGRGVRGEKDYCVILLTGTGLIAAVKDRNLRKYFSPQTRKQIEIGHQLTQFAVEDAHDQGPYEIIGGVMNQCLGRDAGWKRYYSEQMDSLEEPPSNERILDILELEAKGLDAFRDGKPREAVQHYQQIANELVKESPAEKGWYLQEMARMIYNVDREESDRLQKAAHRNNRYLLRPYSGLEVVQLQNIENRAVQIRNWILSFNSFQDLKLHLDRVLSDVVFGPHAKQFEKSFAELGHIIGFNSERPELEWKEGPDNLWCVGPNDYFVIECKTGIKMERESIFKGEAEQLIHSTTWFDRCYPQCTRVPIMVAPTKNMAKGVGVIDGSKILRRSGLRDLKRSVRDFFIQFKSSEFQSITITRINELIINHGLTRDHIVSLFDEPYYKQR